MKKSAKKHDNAAAAAQDITAAPGEDAAAPAKKKHRGWLVVLLILAALVLTYIVMLAANRFGASYADLSTTDQKILSEMEAYRAADEKKTVWQGYDLSETPVLAIHGFWGHSYLIDPAGKIKSPEAKEIKMPDGYGIKVYRITAFSLPVLPEKIARSNFNTVGTTYRKYGNNVYYVKYDEDSLTKKNSSEHFITFLSHEAFHYYMQNDWAGGEAPDSTLSADGLKLLGQEYDVLANVQTELQKSNPSEAALKKLALQYTVIVKQRLEKDPDYVKQELDHETIEGTATYVGILASRAAGYDFGVMYFDNVKNVSFADIMPQYEKGGINASYLARRIPYESGALLCLMLEQLDSGNTWQTDLNAQTKTNQLTLYDEVCRVV